MAHRSRVAAVLALVLVAGVALRGYLPGAAPPAAARPTDGFGSMFAVVAMLAVSLAIIAIAIVTQTRRRPGSPAAGEPPREMSGGRRPLTWRMVLVAVVVVIAWLAVFALLSRMNAHMVVEQQPADAGTPPPGGPQRPPDSPSAPEPSSNNFMLLAGLMATVLLSLFVGAVIVGRLRRDSPALPVSDDGLPARPEPGSDPLARAAEVGLAEAGDLSREPREAIIACYAAMERELENSPNVVPRESDTPSEVLARAVEHRVLGGSSATQLVDLFEEARFSLHVMTEEHRQTAMSALRLVLDELRSIA